MYNYVYVYISIYTFTRKNWPCFQCKKKNIYIYKLASLTISLCLEIPRRLDLLRIRLRRENSTTKGAVSQPQKERIGTSNPSFSGAKDGKVCFQEFLRLVALKMFFFETTSSPTGVPSATRHGGFVWWSFLVLDVFTVRNLPYSRKRTTWVHDIFFVNLCFNMFNPSNRQGPNSTHLWVLGLSLGLGFCLNLGFCLRLCLDFMEEEEEEAKKCQMPTSSRKLFFPRPLCSKTNPPTKFEFRSSSCLTPDMPKQEAGHLLSSPCGNPTFGAVFGSAFLGFASAFAWSNDGYPNFLWIHSRKSCFGRAHTKFFMVRSRHSGFSSKLSHPIL